MPTDLSVDAIEESTYVITAAFTDEDDNPVAPNTGLVWHLTNPDGDIVNSREDVSITPATTVTVVLQGDDLAIASDIEKRIFTIEGTYDSTLGAGLLLKDAARFNVVSLVYFPDAP
jgi:hypothetical protein